MSDVKEEVYREKTAALTPQSTPNYSSDSYTKQHTLFLWQPHAVWSCSNVTAEILLYHFNFVQYKINEKIILINLFWNSFQKIKFIINYLNCTND